jgi:hypothetical protein
LLTVLRNKYPIFLIRDVKIPDSPINGWPNYNIELFHEVHRKPIFFSSDKENAYKTYEVLYSFFGCSKNNELDHIVDDHKINNSAIQLDI